MLKTLFTLAIFATVALAQRDYPNFDRSCDERKEAITPFVKDNFNVAAYSGTWFEVRRYQQENEPEADCLSSAYSWGFVSRSFDIRRGGLVFGEERSIFTREATALLAFPDESTRRGILNVTYYADREADTANYYVLGTDYFQYAVGWACEDLDGNRSREFAWVLSRTPELPEQYIERVDEYVEQFFDPTFIRDTNQDDSDCFDDIENRELRRKFAEQKKLKNNN